MAPYTEPEINTDMWQRLPAWRLLASASIILLYPKHAGVMLITWEQLVHERFFYLPSGSSLIQNKVMNSGV